MVRLWTDHGRQADVGGPVNYLAAPILGLYHLGNQMDDVLGLGTPINK